MIGKAGHIFRPALAQVGRRLAIPLPLCLQSHTPSQ